MIEDIPTGPDEQEPKASDEAEQATGGSPSAPTPTPTPAPAPVPTPAPINLGAPQSITSSTPPTKDDYNSEVVNDRTRTWIALALLGITGVIVLITFVLTSWAMSPNSADANLKAILAVINVIFGPIIALLGSVIGFYFGSRAASGNNGGK